MFTKDAAGLFLEEGVWVLLEGMLHDGEANCCSRERVLLLSAESCGFLLLSEPVVGGLGLRGVGEDETTKVRNLCLFTGIQSAVL